MAFIAPGDKRRAFDTDIKTSPKSNKRRKLSKAKESCTKAISGLQNCESDDSESVGDDGELQKENCSMKPTLQQNVPTKFCEFASVQNVVSDLAAAAAKDNNNCPLNLSKDSLKKEVEQSSCESFKGLLVPPGTPVDTESANYKSGFDSSIDDSETSSEADDCLSPGCLNREDALNESLNDSHSMLSPSLLHSESPKAEIKNEV